MIRTSQATINPKSKEDIMSFPLVFEDLVPLFKISGTGTVFESPEYGATTQIEHDQKWGVIFDWTQTGPLGWILCGTWNLKVYLEKMGPEEKDLPNQKDVAFIQGSNVSYKEIIEFPAGIVEDGVYRLVTTITFTGPKGNPGPVVCFGDAGLVQFYTSDV